MVPIQPSCKNALLVVWLQQELNQLDNLPEENATSGETWKSVVLYLETVENAHGHAVLEDVDLSLPPMEELKPDHACESSYHPYPSHFLSHSS
jgi:hypothetical protein